MITLKKQYKCIVCCNCRQDIIVLIMIMSLIVLELQEVVAVLSII